MQSTSNPTFRIAIWFERILYTFTSRWSWI